MPGFPGLLVTRSAAAPSAQIAFPITVSMCRRRNSRPSKSPPRASMPSGWGRRAQSRTRAATWARHPRNRGRASPLVVYPDARARIARNLERLILGEPAWWVSQANSFNSNWLEDAIPSFTLSMHSSGTATSIDSEDAGFIPTSHAGPCFTWTRMNANL
jgi:hypothetical protein